MTVTARSRRIVVVLGTALTIAAGTALYQHLPVSTDVYAPFDVHADLGERATGRALTGTVDSLTIAPALRETNGDTRAATGVWVVLDGSFAGVTESGLAQAELLVGPNRYGPTDRLLAAPAMLQPGIDDRRQWVFDVAPEALDDVDSVVFRIWVGDGRLDSRLVIDVPVNGPRAYRIDTVPEKPPTQEVG